MASFKYLYTDGDGNVFFEASSFGPDDIALAEGNILIGDSAGAGVALDLGATDAGIPIGNGTTATIAALSGDVAMDNTGATTIQDGVVQPAKQGAEIVNSWSESPVYDVVRVLDASFFDGTANEIFALPENTFVRDVILTVTSGAGEACTLDVGTDDADWSFHNNDPNAFVEAFDVENGGVSVRMSALDVASQAAAAQSGDGISTGSAGVLVTSSADVSASNLSVIATLSLTKLDPSVFT